MKENKKNLTKKAGVAILLSAATTAVILASIISVRCSDNNNNKKKVIPWTNIEDNATTRIPATILENVAYNNKENKYVITKELDEYYASEHPEISGVKRLAHEYAKSIYEYLQRQFSDQTIKNYGDSISRDFLKYWNWLKSYNEELSKQSSNSNILIKYYETVAKVLNWMIDNYYSGENEKVYNEFYDNARSMYDLIFRDVLPVEKDAFVTVTSNIADKLEQFKTQNGSLAIFRENIKPVLESELDSFVSETPGYTKEDLADTMAIYYFDNNYFKAKYFKNELTNAEQKSFGYTFDEVYDKLKDPNINGLDIPQLFTKLINLKKYYDDFYEKISQYIDNYKNVIKEKYAKNLEFFKSNNLLEDIKNKNFLKYDFVNDARTLNNFYVGNILTYIFSTTDNINKNDLLNNPEMVEKNMDKEEEKYQKNEHFSINNYIKSSTNFLPYNYFININKSHWSEIAYRAYPIAYSSRYPQSYLKSLDDVYRYDANTGMFFGPRLPLSSRSYLEIPANKNSLITYVPLNLFKALARNMNDSDYEIPDEVYKLKNIVLDDNVEYMSSHFLEFFGDTNIDLEVDTLDLSNTNITNSSNINVDYSSGEYLPKIDHAIFKKIILPKKLVSFDKHFATFLNEFSTYQDPDSPNGIKLVVPRKFESDIKGFMDNGTIDEAAFEIEYVD
ncbi:hypothetical protein [Metamycoplasma neophronis]|uniref:Uncharacterized protein n=1 Tax=Metamycoplasma neophronis TaxID=872983 RepID=A0ABY2Z438_9BACT|nr:hypothetical protein [Metamycoplasma neophronis]TPR53532.1 hypothetical protein FJR74_02435 [Metamycoplasma neophronis]